MQESIISLATYEWKWMAGLNMYGNEIVWNYALRKIK